MRQWILIAAIALVIGLVMAFAYFRGAQYNIVKTVIGSEYVSDDSHYQVIKNPESGDAVSEKNRVPELADAEFSIPKTDLPDWVTDPTMGQKHKGVFSVVAKGLGGFKEQRGKALSVAKSKFGKLYPSDDVTKVIQRALYVDSASGLMFIWVVLTE